MDNSGTYLLASEFSMLLAVWLGPPLLIAFGIQMAALTKSGRGTGAIFGCFLLTAVLSVAVLIGLMVTDWSAPKRLNAALMLPAPYELWVMPIAFPVVSAVAVLVTLVFAGRRPWTMR